MSKEGLTFYRCMLCANVVSVWDVGIHGCCRHCGGVRIRPTNLTLLEKIVQIIKHPRIWEWKNCELIPAQQGRPKKVREDVSSDTDAVQGPRVRNKIH